jgi:hypothetical protein
MEIELTRISFEADVYDVRKAVAAVLHGPDLFDPNDRENKGRVPNFRDCHWVKALLVVSITERPFSVLAQTWDADYSSGDRDSSHLTTVSR